MTNQATQDPAPSLPEASGNIVEMLRVPAITLHAFCDTAETATALEAAAADRRMSRAHTTVQPGGIAAALEMYGKITTPDLVLFESRAGAAELFGQLDALANVCSARTKVVVIGHANDIELYRGVLTRGVSEYIVAPVDPISVIAAVSRLYHVAGNAKLGRTFAFVGARGGVGSSTVAHNVAASMARLYSSDVILADLDLSFGSAGLAFNLDHGQGVAQALQDTARLDDGLFERLLNKCGEHLSVLTAPASLEACSDLTESAFEHLIDIARSSVPFVVLDMPHVWTAWAKKTLLSAEEIVVTAAPDLVGLRNAKNLVAALQRARPNDGPPRLVLNQMGVPKRAEIKPGQFAKALGLEPAACIAFEPSTFSAAANDGRMVVDTAVRSPASRHFAQIARAIAGRPGGRDVQTGRFGLKRLWRR
jgi:pilus assembly protein CpaE